MMKNHSAQQHQQPSPRRWTTASIIELILRLSIGVIGFFIGSLYTMHVGITQAHDCKPNTDTENLSHLVEEAVHRGMQDLHPTKAQPCQMRSQSVSTARRAGEVSQTSESSSTFSIPRELTKLLVGVTRTSKTDFFDYLDPGVAMDPEKEGDSQVLILHQRSQTLPSRFKDYSEPIPFFENAQESMEHCDMVNVLFMDHSGRRNQCLAIVPQYESYILQKYMRHLSTGTAALKGKPISSDIPLRLVGRGMKDNGFDEFLTPTAGGMKSHMDMLLTYFQALPDVLKDLDPILKRISGNKAGKNGKTLTVMVSNFGQSELLINFVCAANSRNLDISSIILFATDVETKELAENLGLAAYYDERNFGSMPHEAAQQYGDRKFVAMMMAKVFCVHMVSSLNYNILFQDVDLVWYKNPIAFFETQNLQYDLLFQDDGSHSVRYAPYSANSGFYYVRTNPKTKYLFQSLLLSGDLIQRTESHQQVLIKLLTEHSSLLGLKTKVFSRDSWEFPGGYQYHQRSGIYMKDFFAGKIEPYIFHMSWTHNKDNKLLFFRQMGEWYVQEQCIQHSVGDILVVDGIGGDDAQGKVEDGELFTSKCCSAKPIVSCHYRDKPSVIPCKDSPPIDAGRPSFW